MSCDHWNAHKTSPDIVQLAEDWATTPRPDWADPDDRLYQWLHSDPDRCLSAICAIAQIAQSPETLAILAAGPLEDFLGTHGEQYFDTIRTIAHNQPRFLQVLQGVWKGPMSTVLWQRVRAVCAGRI